MAEFIIEKCIEQVSNHFKLALLASQRAHDLSTGAGQTSKVGKHKSTVMALCEIAEKKVSVNELFSLLVKRCKEYSTGGVKDVNEGKLKKLLDFSLGNITDSDTQSDGSQ